ncbi:MAG: hypothetical protein AVDCRST_MAG87-1407 [uncultured Thermomicrobiales bacterium]|uniref:Uncharacterized protein n=1 Tax=uncultured Thermomicrobiales bacterium TaxID=1645740 RepID=A0A6J4UUP7_9BACT|nr:MAG: hypothetical protein AVDCRST_MAG87-1407 [uncultured Thermomicrobiales bacterium]
MIVPASMSISPERSSSTGPTRFLSTSDGGGPKYVDGMSAPIDAGAGCTSSIPAGSGVAASWANALALPANRITPTSMSLSTSEKPAKALNRIIDFLLDGDGALHGTPPQGSHAGPPRTTRRHASWMAPVRCPTPIRFHRPAFRYGGVRPPGFGSRRMSALVLAQQSGGRWRT